jgi:AAA domain
LPLKTIDLSKELEPIQFVVPHLFPAGYLSFLGAREGVGKTLILTGLAWQMTRVKGEFLGFQVERGSSLYVNTDAIDGEARSVRFWLEQHKRTYPDGNLENIHVLEPQSSGLNSDDFVEIQRIALHVGAKLIVIDSFMASFPGQDPNRLEMQMKPLTSLSKLAAESGAAVVVTDHLPKKAVGASEIERGIMGSVAKSAQARAVHLLSRMDTKDTGGSEVIRWFIQKSSFSQRLEPFGIEIIREGQDALQDDRVRLERIKLPQGEITGKDIGANAVTDFLEATRGCWQSVEKLLEVAMKAGKIKDRQARDAVKQALNDFGGLLETRELPKRGKPKEFRVKPKDMVI